MKTRNLILVDPFRRNAFYPLTWSRPVAGLRLGILTIAEKWALDFHAQTSHAVSGNLEPVYQPIIEDDNYWIIGNILPQTELCHSLAQLAVGELLSIGDERIAGHFNKQQMLDFLSVGMLHPPKIQFVEPYQVRRLAHLWELFQWNEFELEADFLRMTSGRISMPIPDHVKLSGNRIFVEEGALLQPCTINTTMGPIYIGHNAEVMEGCMIRGGLALCNDSQLKMGTKVYGATTIGPGCRVGGEVNNSIFQSNANKAHDGFLGNSLIGEWVNIGADTNASNLKNNYEWVKQWSYETRRFEKTNGLFCGLVMGDHAKCGINTMFNTGTVVGFGANVFGAGFPRQFIPDFAWGGASGFSTFTLNKFFQTAHQVMERRGQVMTDAEKNMISMIYEDTSEFRNWETA